MATTTPATANINHVNYEARMAFVKSVLQQNDLKASSIETVEYEPNIPFPYNNFIYLITLVSATTAAKSISSDYKAGMALIPKCTSSLIIRLSNDHPGTDLNNTNRVENEVAFMSLVRQALAVSEYSHIVPDVYAWAPVSSGQGFIMLQHMPGTMPDKGFEELSLTDKSTVLVQVADIFALMQKFELPKTVTQFGGLSFNENEEIISGQMSLLHGGPFESQLDMLRIAFRDQLKTTDKNQVIGGWKVNGIRERLDKLLDVGLNEILAGVKDSRKVLVHSDFTTNNLLFDAKTLRITAFLDFDFSYIATVTEEFVRYSFSNIPGGKLPGPLSSGSKLLLRTALLSNFPDSLPTSSPDDEFKDWEVAKIWDDELIRVGAKTPRNIEGFQKLADIYWLLDSLCPFFLVHEAMRKRKSEEEQQKLRSETEAVIDKFLVQVGF